MLALPRSCLSPLVAIKTRQVLMMSGMVHATTRE